MADSDENRFFDRLAAILNTPLPGTQAPNSPRTDSDLSSSEQAPTDDDSLLAWVRDILSTPLPGTTKSGGAASPEADALAAEAGPTSPSAAPPPSASPADARAGAPPDATPPPAESSTQPPELPQDLEPEWWEREWEAFFDHQDRERRGFRVKQRQDQEKLFQAVLFGGVHPLIPEIQTALSP
jgi:hypothetical protein